MKWLESKWRSLPSTGKKFVGILLAFAVIAGVSALENLITSSGDGSSSATTTTTTTLSLNEARMSLPMFTWFELLADTPGNEIATTCNDTFGGDVIKCYRAYDRGTPDFEERLAHVLRGTFSQRSLDATPPCGTRSYGECVDDYGQYCDESEVVVDEDAQDLRCDY